MIRNIVFDLSRVLIQFDTARYARLAGVPEAYIDQFRNAVYRSPEWLMMERCGITEEKAIARMCSRLPEQLHSCVQETVSGWWKHPLLPMEGMHALLQELKENDYRLYLLSNARETVHMYGKRIPGLELFDGKMFSCDVGILKPQQRIFEALCDEYHLLPEECFFVDDVTANVEAAMGIGFQATVFHQRVDTLRREMLEVGIRIGGKMTDVIGTTNQ